MIWAIFIKQAFITLNRNRKLIGIAFISVVFGKIIDLIEQFTGKHCMLYLIGSVNVDALQQAPEAHCWTFASGDTYLFSF